MRSLLRPLLALVALAVPACGGDDDSDDPSPDREIFVVFRQSGGIMGMNEELHVHRDGQCQLFARPGRHAEAFIARKDADRLRQHLDDAHLEDYEDVRQAPRVPDSIEYEIGFEGRRVTVADPSIPRRLQPVLGELEDVAARCAHGG